MANKLDFSNFPAQKICKQISREKKFSQEISISIFIKMSTNNEDSKECPVCQKKLPPEQNLELHVIECFENQVRQKSSSPSTSSQQSTKRPMSDAASRSFDIFNRAKKVKVDPVSLKSNVIEIDDSPVDSMSSTEEPEVSQATQIPATKPGKSSVIPLVEPPLAEFIRAECFDDYVGQQQVVGENSIFRNLLKSNNITSMIFWGPPGESLWD